MKPTIERNKFGASTVTYTELTKARANVDLSNGGMQTYNDEVRISYNITFRVRHYQDIKDEYRIGYQGKQYRILSHILDKSMQVIIIETQLVND